MIAAQVDRFYRQVVRDFIGSLNRNEEMVRQLEVHNLFLHQIEQMMLSKLANPSSLFHRLTSSYNEIEKEMMSRFANVDEDELEYYQRKHRLSSAPRSRTPSLPSQSLHDDLDCYSENLEHSQQSRQKDVDKPEESNGEKAAQSQREEGRSVSSARRRPSSEFSLEDLSQFEAQYGQTVKRLREKAKIHILGTYDCGSKKHDFKNDQTEIVLDNVFIKVEGVAKEIVLKKLHVLSRKKPHH